MGIGFGFRVMPGVRVRVSSRGVRTSVGPRAARVHVGGGRTTVSSGVGPVTVWANGGRRSGSSTRRSHGPTAAQLQRQATAIARAQAAEDKLARIRELIDLQRELVSAHREQFSDCVRPVVDPPTWVRPDQYRPQAEQRHLEGLGRFDRAGREAARRNAAIEAEQSAASYNSHLRYEHDALQAQADRWWAALTANDEATVIATVNAAFADNASAAAALSVDNAALTVLMIQPTAEELGDQKATLTPGGKPTIARMTKTEQRQLWTACTLSRAIATVAQAFSVAPGIERVNIAVVSPQSAMATTYNLIVAGEAQRGLIRGAQWPSQIGPSDLARGGNFVAEVDRFGALTAIPTANDPRLRALIDGVNGVIDHDDTPAPSLQPVDTPHQSSTLDTQSSVSSPRSTSGRHQLPESPPVPTGPGEPPAASDGKPFALWGRGISYGNVEVKGTEHRQDAILSLLPRQRLREGADLDTTAQLVPEPTNPYDSNAVGCWVDGRLIGYLPREVAVRYHSALAQFVRSGRVPTTNAHVWAREVDDYDYDYDTGRQTKQKKYYTSARIGLAEPDLLGPINLAPPKPRAELPDGGAAKVTGAQENFKHLLSVLGNRSRAWAYASLEATTLTGPRSSKTVVQVLINGRPAGTLSPQMSNSYLPIVEPLSAAGCRTVVRVLLTGSPVSVAATIYAAKAHELSHEWFADLESELGVSLRPA